MSPQYEGVGLMARTPGEAFEMANIKRVSKGAMAAIKGRSLARGKTGMVILPLCALLIVAFLAISIQTSFAMPVSGVSGTSPAGGSLSTYVVVLNTMSPAEARTVYNNVEAVAVQNGGSVVYEFSLVNAVAVNIPDYAVLKLEGVPGVKYLQKDSTIQLSMDQVVNQVDVRNVWNDTTLNEPYGSINGSGITICLIDSGVDDTHPDLQGKINMERDFTNMTSTGPATTAPDYNGHGTFVASEIVGSGVSSMNSTGGAGIYERTIPGYYYLQNNNSDPNYNAMRGPFEGIAQGAKLDIFKTIGADGETSAFTVERALDYATNETDMNNNLPRIISMSLNSGVPDSFFTQEVEAAVSKGIVVVVAAGNDGPAGTVEAPADAPDVISVGSVNRNDTVSFFSAHGPTTNSVAKPDIMGVGENVIAAKPVLNNGNDSALNNFSKYYMIDSGTSMATPEVAAVAALMLQVNPSLTPAQVKELLMQHARQPADYTIVGSDYYGAGILDAYAVLLNLTGGNIPSSPVAPLATIQFDQAMYQVNQNAGILNVTVDALWNTSLPDGTTMVNITYEALSGSGNTAAITGVDYSLPTGNLTLVKNGSENAVSFPVTILNDNIPGANKNVNLQLSSKDNVAIPQPVCDVNIINTNYPTVKFAIDDYTVINGGGNNKAVTFKVDVQANWAGGAIKGPIQVNLGTSNGTAVYGTDYELAGQAQNVPVPLTFSSGGPTDQMVPVTVNYNPATTDTKYFNLILSGVTNATLRSPSSDTVWITGSSSTDTTPPTTTYSISPAASGQNGWYTSNVTVTLTAADNTGGSGVDHIWYNLSSNGYNVKVMGNTTSFIVSTNGTTTVNYWAVDKEGNAESPNSRTLNIDEASPVIYTTLNPSTPTGSNGWYKTSPSVTITAVDPISGINTTEYSLDSGAWTPYTTSLTLGNGQHTLMYGTVDKAGNAANGSIQINVGTQAPIISVTLIPVPPTGSNGWYNTTPQVNITATDATSGIASIAYSLDNGTTWKPYTVNFTVYDGNYKLVYGAINNAGGQSNSTAPIPIKVDTTLPTISGATNASPNANNWYNTSVMVNFTASDSGSGIATITPNITLSGQGANQYACATVVDVAGNSATINVTGINIDKTPPVITGTTTSRANANGWFNTSVTVQFSGCDTISGVNYTTPNVVLSKEGANQNVTGYSIDNAGNNNSTTVTGINIDKTAPVISYNLTPAVPGSNGWYNTTVKVNITANDTTSGVASIAYSLNNSKTWNSYGGNFTLSTGQYLLTYGAVDKAGNQNNSTSAVTINVDATSPVLGQINAPLTPVHVNTAVNVNDTVSGDPAGLASATWNWGDGNVTSGTINNVLNVVNGTHTYASAGTYMIWLNVTDNMGFKNNTTYNFIVVYNPSGGAVIGLGGFNSAAGNFTWKPTKSYAATFGFDSQYVTVKGVTTLQGLTEFVLGTGTDLWFQSVSYDWLVVSGSESIYQGTGTMVGNGSTQYKFIVSSLSTNPNKIRFKIWNATTGAVVYDNEAGAANDALPTQPVSWGGVLIYST